MTRHSEYILIAEIDRPRGLKGEVVVTVHADDPLRMADLESVFLRNPDGSSREIRIEGVKRLGARAVLKLEGVLSVEQARELVGRQLFIPPEASTPAPEGRYYAYQLLGLEARLKDGTRVGRVVDLLTQGPQSLLVLETPDGTRQMVPFVPAICVDVQVERGRILLDPPEGLLEL